MNRTIHIIEIDSGVVHFEGVSDRGRIEVLARMIILDDTLVLDNLHIDGSGIGSLGFAEIRGFARDFGRMYGVQFVRVHGAKRTTGAKPGHFPRPMTFEVK